jgi:hypothetical protein
VSEEWDERKGGRSAALSSGTRDGTVEELGLTVLSMVVAALENGPLDLGGVNGSAFGEE